VRADENPVLLAVHTLYHREHNRLAGEISAACDAARLACTDEDIFQGARQLVVAGQQKVLYEELLPELLGRGVTGVADLAALVPDPGLIGSAPGAINEFTAAAGRIGHSQVPDTILLAEPGGPMREVALARCFFDPACLGGASIEAVLLGAVLQPAEAVDPFVVDSLRNAQRPGFGADILIDLLMTNILRGRDHGLPDYLATRAALGLADLPPGALLPVEILAAYDDPDGAGIDLLVGILGEVRPPDAHLGETGAALWALQFLGLADDPAFYTAPGQSPLVRDWAEQSSIGGLIAANTGLGHEAFVAANAVRGSGFWSAAGPAPAVIPLPPAAALLLAALGLLGGIARVRRHRPAAPDVPAARSGRR
jgi:peroxidase